MIAIFDDGAGCEYPLVHAAGLAPSSTITLPGVGHFGQMLRSLEKEGIPT